MGPTHRHWVRWCPFVGVGDVATESCRCVISEQGGDGRVVLTWVV